MLRTVGVWTGKAGSPWYSTLYWAGTDSNEAQAANDAHRNLMDEVAGQQVAGIVHVQEDFVASVNPTTGDVIGGFVTTIEGPATASNPGDMVPRAAQVQVNFLTGVYAGGRAIRGKMYLPGFLGVQSTADGNIDSQIVTNYTDIFNAALASGPDLLVWSRKNGQAYAVQECTVSPQWAMLRSRRD